MHEDGDKKETSKIIDLSSPLFGVTKLELVGHMLDFR